MNYNGRSSATALQLGDAPSDGVVDGTGAHRGKQVPSVEAPCQGREIGALDRREAAAARGVLNRSLLAHEVMPLLFWRAVEKHCLHINHKNIRPAFV